MVADGSVERVFNFSAGPAVLPVPVLQRVQREMVALPGCGASILEISHRSPEFMAIMASAERRLRNLLAIPDQYKVLFLQGGSRLQFSMVPMNLLRGATAAAAYVLTGSWGKYALKEAKREGPTQVVWDGAAENYTRLPRPDEMAIPATAAFVHVTSNETIQGVQFPHDWDWGGAPVACDMSSDFLWRPVDVARYGLIYACAQKNAGPAGVTVVIIREDLLSRSTDALPGYLNYREHVAADSMFNTPPTFAVYVLDLVAQWLQEEIGGLAAMADRNRRKAKLLYDVLDAESGFYAGHAQPSSRSTMNVTFRLPSESLEKAFLQEAESRQLTNLAGHRSVGGIRASIYNAMPEAGVLALRDFMLEFRRRHS